ncbi:ABC transporter permease [Thermoanaerobacter sp. CM-CNRG TB177]|uniref:ABC transporter permease n=1 Tax=Thermoanaerobacter sp. CM-CNRG TB177 TaxID=2800659 RepID=UPI001BDDFFD2|nr:ABC transporter permease [Thermoanaerobacter sp. CM-CNRG TB177]MBT1279729.1 ABC transporter permease [Thermoanaerobacter sp. CM-CNRG TB177]
MRALFKLALRNIIAKKVRFFILFLTFVLSAVTLMAAIFFKDAAIESKEGLVYSIGITLKNLDSISDVANDIRKVIGSGYIVEERYDIESYKAYVGTISIALSIFSAFTIFITLFLTYSTFKTVLYERISQIGTLRSLGATKMEIFISTYIESFIIITISTIIGLIVGFPFLHFILKLIVEDEIIMKFSILKFMLVFFMLLITGLLSVILSVLRIFKISVVDIIKGNVEKHTKKKNILKNYAGTVMIFVSIILLILSEKMDNGIFYLISGIILFSFSFILLIEFLHILINNTLLKFINLLGPEARLLNKEFKRDFSRSAESIILISIIIGIAYLSFTLSYLVKESVDKVYKGVDIVINTDSSMGSLDEKLSSISGVDKVVSQLRVKERIRDMDVEISGIDPEKYKDFSFEIYKNGSIDELFKQLNYGKNIIITNTFAKNTNTKVGDYIQIKSKTKEKGEKYKVIGVVSSFENMGKVLFISKDNFIKDIGSNDYTLYLLKIKKNYNVSQVENGITEMLGKGAYYSYKFT